MLSDFKINNIYTIEEIYKSLRVGNAGGVRLSVDENSKVRRIIVLTTNASARQEKENPYHDRIEGDVLVYTGAGKEGDQFLSGANRRIPQQIADAFPIYGFLLLGSRRSKQYGSRRWTYLGMLEYLRHYQDWQLDTRGTLRKVWLYEFHIHDKPHTILIDNDMSIAMDILTRDSHQRTDEEDRQVAEPHGNGSGAGSLEQFARLEAVRGKLLNVAPKEFEVLIKDVLLLSGFERVGVTRYSQDGGIDVVAYPGERIWPLQDVMVQLQAKRWLHAVGRKEVAELRGSLDAYARGVVVTTSHFSKAAIVEARLSGKNPIGLVDGLRLSSIIVSIKPSWGAPEGHSELPS